MAEEEGFEPPRGLTRLSVFKTDPFSRTWVFLRIDNGYLTIRRIPLSTKKLLFIFSKNSPLHYKEEAVFAPSLTL
jgi:hypothetical protein